MSNPDDDTGVPSGLNDDAEMERTQPRAPLTHYAHTGHQGQQSTQTSAFRGAPEADFRLLIQVRGLITSTNWNLSPHGHFARSHGLHGPTRHPTAGANRQNDQKRPSCAHGRSANSRYAIQAAKGGHMSRLVRWS